MKIMIDHITYRVRDIEKTISFYNGALAPFGYEKTFDQVFDGVRVIGYGKNGKLDTWFTTDTPVSGPTHLAYATDSQAEVDAFYKAAMAAGGTDNGAPGKRPEYGEAYYGAFVLDPDGNNIEAVFRG